MSVPALVMLALGLWGLDRGGMWRDEAVTFQVSRRTVPQIWRLLHGVDAVHGLYYLLMHAVLAVRPDEVALRLPSVCAAAVTAGLVAALGARLVRARVGLWAGLFYAITPMAGHYAQEGRSYALVAAGATGATLQFVRAVQGGSWWAYGVVLGLTCWLHEFAVLLLLAHAVTLALARARARVWRAWGCAAGAVGLALLPMALVSNAQSAQVAWLRQPTMETAQGLLRTFLGPTDAVYWTCLGLAVLGLAGLLGRRGEVTCAGVCLPLAVVPPVVLMLVSQLSPLYVDRYVLYALSGAPVLVAAGAERVAAGAGRVAGAVGAWRVVGAAGLGWVVRAVGVGWVAAAVGVGWVAAAVGVGWVVRAVGAGRVAGAVGRLWGKGRPVAPSPLLTLTGLVALGLVLAQQLPLLRGDRSPAHRPDDLAAVSRAAGRELRAGDRVLFLPEQTRNAALAYPGAFRGARDVALARTGADSGTLYGREVSADTLRRRMAGLKRVWVVADRDLLGGRWRPGSPTERAKLAVLAREFVPGGERVQDDVTVRLYVRPVRVSGAPGPLPGPPRPARS
ncbi:glycosyltransferase family 39 protein [Streptomyces sp. NPDC020800]|uniref:glycosyltransferase family 39 protein n=1 Tax=Streptomyces sp. NPDC020800 TaxID=3365092 RepID=UPI0037B64FD2